MRIKNAQLIQPLVNVVKMMSKSKIRPVFGLIAKLFNSNEIEKDMCRQFVAARGLQMIKKMDLLNQDDSIINLVDVLLIFCQFCRISSQREYDRQIDELDIYEDLKRCFVHPEPAVRSKACNLIGHMSKHSEFFYNRLKTSGIIKLCIECCRD